MFHICGNDSLCGEELTYKVRGQVFCLFQAAVNLPASASEREYKIFLYTKVKKHPRKFGGLEYSFYLCGVNNTQDIGWKKKCIRTSTRIPPLQPTA